MKGNISLGTSIWKTLPIAVFLSLGANTFLYGSSSVYAQYNRSFNNSIDTTITPLNLEQVGYVPRFEKSICPFDPPEGFTVECGNLIVPEDRSNPMSHTIKLAVGIFRTSNSKLASDPVVFLQGGPGFPALRTITSETLSNLEPFLSNRDFITFDQRGTGFSDPILACPEESKVLDKLIQINSSPKFQNLVNAIAVQKCATQLLWQGINLNSYNSAESAADLADLRKVLGYDQWNLYGVSYGTRLALTTMRDQPEGLRSVILDSAVPLNVNLFATTGATGKRALDTLFARCANDQGCSAAYPNLKKIFKNLVRHLDSYPITILRNDPSNGQNTQIVINGYRFYQVVFDSLYFTDVIPELPRVIYDTHDGNYEALTMLVHGNPPPLRPPSTTGAAWAVACNELYPFIKPKEFINDRLAFPISRNALISNIVYNNTSLQVCKSFITKQPNPIENAPVESNIPTLILAGEYDPITPPIWGRIAAQTLNQSFFYEFPGLGHVVSRTSSKSICPNGIIRQFLDNPTQAPNTTCINELPPPNFSIPN